MTDAGDLLDDGATGRLLAQRLPPGTMLADIGGTNARFIAIDDNGAPVRPIVLPTRDFVSLAAAWQAWRAASGDRPPPTRAAIAVACPVDGDLVTFTNLSWQFSVSEMRHAFGLENLTVVNDAAAIAQGLPWLRDGDLEVWQAGEPPAFASPYALIAPGTGLGVAGLVPLPGDVGQRWQAIRGEGGHVTLAARNAAETALIERLRAKFGHVSAERALSGPGLVNIHGALLELDGVTAPSTTPEALAACLAAGGDARVERVFSLFAALLGTIASDMALSFDARGGVFIGGGILPALGDMFDRDLFLARFADKGRFAARLRACPVSLIRHPFPAFVGLAALLAAGKGATETDAAG